MTKLKLGAIPDDKPVKLKGQVQGNLTLAGRFGDPKSRRGGGTILISQAQMFKVPLMLAILQVIHFAIDDDNAFHDAMLDYIIDGSELILQEIDLFIVLAVYPGFGGQPFSPITIKKIRQAAELREKNKANFDIGVDGSVNIKTVPKIVKAGANYLIAGSSVFKGDIAKNVETLQKLGEDALETTLV